MEKKEKVIFTISVVAGVIAAVLIYFHIQSLKRKIGYRKFEYVIVSKKNIGRGGILKREYLRYVRIPSDYLPTGVIKRGDEKFIINAVAKRRIEAGTPICSCQITPFGGKEYYISRIPAGYLPHTVTLDPESQVGGYVRRGERVDIYLFTPSGGGRLIPLVREAKVVWIEKKGKLLDFTFALKREDLYRVMMGRNKGVIWIIPSRAGNPAKPVSWNQLMGYKKRKKLPGVEILRGK